MSDYSVGLVITQLMQQVASLELEVSNLQGQVRLLGSNQRISISAGTISAGTISAENIESENKGVRKYYHSSDVEFITVVSGEDSCTIVSQSNDGVKIKQLRVIEEEQLMCQDGLKY